VAQKQSATADAAKKQPTKPRRKRSSLSREIIVAAAQAVAEREGLEGLTFQAIGAELDAHPTSVYRHFRDKDELVLEMIDTLRDRSYGGTLIPSDSWREDLRRAARAIHEHYLRYPRFALEMAARTTRRPAEFHNVEFVLQALLKAGLDEEEAILSHRAFGNYVRAMSGIEAAMSALPEQTRRADDLAWQVEYRELDPDMFPTIASLSRPLPGIGDPGLFDLAIELLLDGIEARAKLAGSARAQLDAQG
jgi:AcrR family transcriptional regulator